MPLFRCDKCGCVENTALSNYWSRGDGPALCSGCDPDIAAWHGEFDQKPADGYYQDKNGFIYAADELERFKHLGPFAPVVAAERTIAAVDAAPALAMLSIGLIDRAAAEAMMTPHWQAAPAPTDADRRRLAAAEEKRNRRAAKRRAATERSA
jgi:hypothetical protein